MNTEWNSMWGAVQTGLGDNMLQLLGALAILSLVVAMGLCAMGIIDDIVNLAFDMTLGTIAVAVALSSGLGRRSCWQADGTLAVKILPERQTGLK